MNLRWDGVDFIRVAANGLTFEVATAGSGDHLALCLHGFPEHAFSWRHQVPLLVELGYRVWAPNLRGYGETDAPLSIAAYRLNVLVEDVVALIAASGALKITLIAHDWGGMLAWTLAMRHPELLQRLVICNLPHPACFLRESKRPRQILRSWYVLFFQLPRLPEALLGARGAARIGTMLRDTTHDPSVFPEDVLALYQQNAARPGRLTAMLNWYRALLRGGGWRSFTSGTYPMITTPTLLIWGDADVALSVHTIEGTEKYVSDLTVHVLPGVSHWVQQEAPEAVNAMLKAWLTRGNP
jgi:pimeloyl-ACP methyl ester carboxylesterase